MKIIDPAVPKLDFKDVLILPKTSYIDSRKNVNLFSKCKFKYSRQEWSGVPIISSNMDSVSDLNTFDILKRKKYLTCFPKHYNTVWANSYDLPKTLSDVDYYMISCGINERDIDNVDIILKKLEDLGHPLKFLCIDIANGYLVNLIKTCSYFRDKYPHLTIVAGNVVTPKGVEDLVLNGGVDIVKIGIGSGLCCTTRKQTGVGYPQLSAVLDCGFMASSLHAHSISDGGVTCNGDICKAFVAGADFVMLGSMLAGHDESPGEIQGNHKILYGMSSSLANEKHNGGLNSYRASEGRIVKLPLRGPMIRTLQQIEGGLRSACTYINAKNINDMYYQGKFILVNQQYDNTFENFTIGF